MLSFKKGFNTAFSKKERKPEAFCTATSSIQIVQLPLLRMETRLITQALRLHRTKFTDRTNIIQQYTQRQKDINVSLIGQTSLKGGEQKKKGMKGQKRHNLSNDQTKE